MPRYIDADALFYKMLKTKDGLQAETKACKSCGEKKLIEDFSKDKSKHDGLSIYCRQCCKQKKARK